MPYESATYIGHPNRVINRGLNANHFQLNKYPERNSEYKAVLAELIGLLQRVQRNIASVPEPLVRTFISRPKLLRAADAAIDRCSGKTSRTCTVVFHGLGGAGKSQLARKAVEEWMNRYSTIFWIDAHNHLTLEMSFVHFATKIGLEVIRNQDSGGSLENSPAVQRVLTWFQHSYTPSRLWLVVVDSAENLSTNELRAIVPNLDNGHVVMTSSDPLTCRRVAGDCVGIEVHSMEPVEASALLLRHMGINYEDSNGELRNASLDVSRRLGHLALAVDLAGAYIAEQEDPRPLFRLTQYSVDFEQHQDYLLRREPFSNLSSYTQTIWTVWDKSLTEIQSRYPSAHAEKLLTLLSALDGNIIHDDIFRLASAGISDILPKVLPPYEILPSWMEEWIHVTNSEWDSFKFREAIHLLTRYSLVRRIGDHPYKGTRIHSLVQWRARQDQSSEPWTDWLITLMSAAIYPTLHDRNESHLRQILVTHIFELNRRHGIFNCIKSRNTWSGWVFSTLGRFYQDEGQWCRAIQLHQHAFDIYSEVLGYNHLETVQVYSDMAISLHGQGRWLEAAEIQQWIWKACVTSLGSDDPITLVAMAQLAITYSDLEVLDKSEEMALYVLQARNISLGEWDQATLSSMNFVACVYLKQGRIDEAEKLLLRAIRIGKEIFGDLNEATATYEVNLASAYSISKRWVRAQETYRNVLEKQRKLLGEVHPLRLKTMSNLAVAYGEQGDLVKSEFLFRDLVKLRKENQGYCHPETLDSMAGMAYVLRLQGKKEEALTLLGECVAIARDKLSSNHPYRVKFEAAIEDWQRSSWEVLEMACLDFLDQVLDLISACVVAGLQAWSTPVGLLLRFFE